MAGLSDLDRTALVRGGAVAAMIALPVQFVAQLVLDEDERSGWAAVLTLVILGGLVLGAGVAAWHQQRRTPLSHGMVTAAGTYLVIQFVLTVVKVIRGDDVRWGRIATSFALSMVAGILGGYLGSSLTSRGLRPRGAR